MPSSRRQAFTLLELLIVLAIMAVLLALLLPAIQNARESANRIACGNHLHQLGVAFHQHHDVYQVLPSNGGWDGRQSIPTTVGSATYVTVTEFVFDLTFTWGVGQPGLDPPQQTGSWAFALLPFVEQQAVYDNSDWRDPLALYLCPSRGRPGTLPGPDDQYGRYGSGGWSWSRTDYAANAFVVANRPACLRLTSITDGTAQTVLAGEKAFSPLNYQSGTWYWDEPLFVGGSGGTSRGFGTKPGEGTTLVRDASDMGFDYRYNWGSSHPGGTPFLFADGSVRLLPYRTASPTVAALLTPNGGEVVVGDL